MHYRKILFITGTRADFGKIKGLISALDKEEDFEVHVYVSGMHLLSEFGNTFQDVLNENYKNVFVDYTQLNSNVASIDCGNVVINLSSFVKNIKPDMIVVHGDRIEALAGAIVGIMNNICVAHIEGGEVTGTMDDSIRHAVSKLAHIHFVTTMNAKKRLLQLGETSERIFVIGSTDIDIMLSKEDDDIANIKMQIGVEVDDKYAILIYHPVTTEVDQLSTNIGNVIEAIKRRDYNYIVIYPNNDLGHEIIMGEYDKLKHDHRFHFFRSFSFEMFLDILKNAEFIIGNSSTGVIEAGVYGVPAIDVGTRQNSRDRGFEVYNMQHTSENVEDICFAIDNIESYRVKNLCYGKGNSVDTFINILKSDVLDDISLQKVFNDI